MTAPVERPKIAPECEDGCAYGTCHGGLSACGGCCGCLGPCVVAYEHTKNLRDWRSARERVGTEARPS